MGSGMVGEALGGLSGSGVVWDGGGHVGRGGRGTARTVTAAQAIPCLVEDGYGFPVG